MSERPKTTVMDGFTVRCIGCGGVRGIASGPADEVLRHYEDDAGGTGRCDLCGEPWPCSAERERFPYVDAEVCPVCVERQRLWELDEDDEPEPETEQTARWTTGIAPHWLDETGHCVRCGLYEPAPGGPPCRPQTVRRPDAGA